MTNFLLCALAAVGTTLIIVRGVIFLPLRNMLHNTFLEEPINCCQCSGFWIGLFWGICYITLAVYPQGQNFHYAIIVLAFGCMNSLLSMAADISFDLFYRLGNTSNNEQVPD